MKQSSIEEVREFWDRRPCNIRHSLAEPGTKRWSEEVTKRKYFVEPHIPDFAQFWRWRRKVVIEIGCGIGTDTLEFVRAGADVHAMDLSKESLRLAERTVDALNLPDQRLHFYCDNAEDAFPRVSADLVYAFGSLHHAVKPERILQNAFYALKPGGELRIMVYAKYSIKNIIRQQPEAQKGCPIVRVFSVEEAREMVQDAGFVVLSIHKDHIFPYRIPDYIRHRYVKIWPYSHMSSSTFAWLERHFGWHLLLVAKKPVE